MLSAASCNKWWQDAIIGTNDYKGEEAKIAPEMLGRNHVYFLPYLMGERSPINDTNARAMFVLSLIHISPQRECGGFGQKGAASPPSPYSAPAIFLLTEQP